MYGAQTENGTNIAVYNNNGGSNNQKWKLVSIDGSNKNTDISTSSNEWSAWSDWSITPISGNDNRQAESKTQYAYYHYHLTYDNNNVGTYLIDMKTANENFKNLPNAHVKAEKYHTYYSDTHLNSAAADWYIPSTEN